MNKRGISIWDVLAWIVLALILLWLILKTLGVINTSLLLEYAPIYGAVYLAGWQMHKLESVAEDVRELKQFKYATISEINSLKTNCVKNHGK
ncbi:MAG: hypothetical protein KKE50_07300 [Nanoarchaeota archaeon]|nr:hypothetical protein [Nanoarchaeota archaeon]